MQNLASFDRMFATEDDCKRYLQQKRWPDGVRCPRCGAKEKVYALAARPFHWVCKSGAETVDKKSGEVDLPQAQRIPIQRDHSHDLSGYKNLTRTWFKIGFLMLTAKKGVSSLQVRRMVFGERSGTDWRTCWYICHRWRAAMKGDAFSLTAKSKLTKLMSAGKKQTCTRASASGPR